MAWLIQCRGVDNEYINRICSVPWIHTSRREQSLSQGVHDVSLQKCMRRGTRRPLPAGDGETAEFMRKCGSRTAKLERGPLFKKLSRTAERYRIRRSEGTPGNSWLCPCSLTPVALLSRRHLTSYKYVRWCIHYFRSA